MKPVKKEPMKARQGERGPSMLTVLGIGIAATVVAFAIIGWINSDGDMASLGVVGDEPAAGTGVSPDPAVDGAYEGIERDDRNNLERHGTVPDTPNGFDETRPLEEG